MSGQFNVPGAVTPVPTEEEYGWAVGPLPGIGRKWRK